MTTHVGNVLSSGDAFIQTTFEKNIEYWVNGE